MGGADNGCGSGLLGVPPTSKLHFSTEQHSPFGSMLPRLGDATTVELLYNGHPWGPTMNATMIAT